MINDKSYLPAIMVTAMLAAGVLIWQSGSVIVNHTVSEQNGEIATTTQIAATPEIVTSTETSSVTQYDPNLPWATYRNEELGIEFRYPQEWGRISFTSGTLPVSAEERGSSFYGQFSNASRLGFCGVTPDFVRPIGPGFCFFRGYTQKEIAGNVYRRIPFTTIVLVGGSKALLFTKYMPYDQAVPPSTGSRGAYLNLPGPQFHGIAFFYNLIPSRDKDIFDQMIESIKFLR